MNQQSTLGVANARSPGRTTKLFAIAMIRNDADIIIPFLRQSAELFDKLTIVDVQSTDGTIERISNFSDSRLELETLSITRQEKYQSALMNLLSRKAFAEGADWVFLLDADEFVDVPSRAFLENYLFEFKGDVMHLPWLNLVPSRYGSYCEFDLSQDFFWSGRASQYTKVALSSLFAANNPDYYVHEGNHSVSRKRDSEFVETHHGLPLLHVPIRSAARTKYKISGAVRITNSKHNRLQGEGSHVGIIQRLLSSGNVGHEELNFLAANYGDSFDEAQALDPRDLEWPSKRMHEYLVEKIPSLGNAFMPAYDLAETLNRDGAIAWDDSKFVKDSPVAAVLNGDHINIVPQPLRGSGRPRQLPFTALGPRQPDPRTPDQILADAAAISCMKVERFAFSAWSELVPLLFSLFSFMRPRRYVELGVHNGMSFFGACQAAQHLELRTECVAVDSWIGDEHAGFHTSDVFDGFCSYIKEKYPDQTFIRTYFESALPCFEEGSIDLLHIDGLHTYAAVKRDFETWLPKMSDTGIVILHDTNVFERGFGVWRLWEELKTKYPSFNFLHKHGLGILYVGRTPSPFAEFLQMLEASRGHAVLAQTYFESIGTFSIEYTTSRVSISRLENEITRLSPLENEVIRLENELKVAKAVREAIAQELASLQNSTTWKATSLLRSTLCPSPRLQWLARRLLRR